MKRPEPVTAEYAAAASAKGERAQTLLGDLIAARGGDALVRLVCVEVSISITELRNAIGDILTDVGPLPVLPLDDAPAARAPKAGGDHRHTFSAAGVCAKCGKVKSANGRKPGGVVAAEAPPVDTRTLSLPVPPMGDAAADRFSGGSHGSSGVVRR